MLHDAAYIFLRETAKNMTVPGELSHDGVSNPSFFLNTKNELQNAFR